MDIREALEYKERLEKEIQESIRKFEVETGLLIAKIEQFRPMTAFSTGIDVYSYQIGNQKSKSLPSVITLVVEL